MRKPYMDYDGTIHFDEVDSPSIDALDLRVSALEQGGGGGGSASTKFKALKASATLASGATLNTPSVQICKDISLTAHIEGAISNVAFGVGYRGYYGRWFVIDATTIKVYTSSSETLGNTYTHGLTLGNNTTIVVSTEWGGTNFIALFNDKGEVFKTNISWGVNVGQPFVLNNGTSSINATFEFMPKDITKKIWFFGDSYLSLGDSARWITYPYNYGFRNWFLNAMGGIGSTASLTSLRNLLATGAKPTYLVWCLGMNDGGDSATAPASNWKNTIDSVLQLCDTYGITPILATIPSVPSIDHSKKIAYVRNSGYRYIDFAKAVENGTNANWKDGMLSSDNVHPTYKGAIALASACMADFPEITLMED